MEDLRMVKNQISSALSGYSAVTGVIINEAEGGVMVLLAVDTPEVRTEVTTMIRDVNSGVNVTFLNLGEAYIQ